MGNYYVLIVSDGTGETAYRLLKAAMRQFDSDILITRYAKVREKSQIEDIIKAVKRSHTLIVHTFASKELRDHMRNMADKEGAEWRSWHPRSDGRRQAPVSAAYRTVRAGADRAALSRG